MTLVLHGIALNEQPMSQPLTGRFDERGGTLGRSETVTFTLPDPERMISRIQAQILHRDDGYWVENVSAANPILHNGRLLSGGMRVLLRDGDELGVGGYTLKVAFESDEASATILRGRTAITNREFVRATPGFAPQPAAAQPAAAQPAAAPPATPQPAAAQPAAAQPAAAQPAAAQPATPQPVGPQRNTSQPIAPRPVEPPPSPERSQREAPLAAGQVVGVSAPTTPGGEALWRAFLEGAGIELPLPEGLSREHMERIGAMMRIATEGLFRLVAMRATAKDQIQAQMTMIQVRGNNPLKFAPDAAVALQLLLKPATRGFLAGPAAVRDAVIDLQSHQVGVMAGMRSALEAVLDRFDPTSLEAALGTRSVFDSLRPAHRKARLWELYLEHYRSLREEAQEDFHRFFGDAFREAYEAQVLSLDAAYDATTPPGPRTGGEPR